MVFDVESIGLHGEGFAFGAVVVDETGKELFSRLCHCPPGAAEGMAVNRDWVRQNCPPINDGMKCDGPEIVRDEFWSMWIHWKAQGAILVSDCGWPVEANFLERCVKSDIANREWSGPYPLHDLASVMLAHGMNPLDKHPRRDNELPEHNPLCDARQSARLLMSILNPEKVV